MEKDVKDVHGSFVFNHNITIEQQYAVFDGSAYFTLLALANNEHSDEFQIGIEFKLDNSQLGNIVAIVGNGRCNTEPSFSVRIDGALTDTPTLVVEIKNETSSSSEIRHPVVRCI